MKTTILIEIGSPSGSTTEFSNRSAELSIPKELVQDFVDSIIEYAGNEAKEDHWQVEVQKHEWKPSGWRVSGLKPTAHEWECVHCGEVVEDGHNAPSEYCEEAVE